MLLHFWSASHWLWVISAATFPRAKNDIICFVLGRSLSAHPDEFLYVYIETAVWVNLAKASQALLTPFTVTAASGELPGSEWEAAEQSPGPAELWIQAGLWAVLSCEQHWGLDVPSPASRVCCSCTVSENVSPFPSINSCTLLSAQLTPNFCLLGKHLSLTGWRLRELG